MCTGVEIALVTAAVAGASATGYSTSESVQAGRRAKNKQEDLEKTRRDQLAGEAATRDAARLKAETAGQRAGRGNFALSDGLFGFGSGNTASGGTGRGQLFGN